MRVFAFLFVVGFAVPAFAQGTITVIGDDGQAKSVEIEDPFARKRAPEKREEIVIEPTPRAPAPEVRREGESVIFRQPRAVVEPPPPPEEGAPEPAPEKLLAATPKPEAIVEPVPAEAAPVPESAVVKPQAKPTPVQKPAKVVKPDTSPYELWEQNKSVGRVIPAEGGLTKDQAMQIAIDHAPPARDFQIFQTTHEGKAAYLFAFKTEAGQVDVLVDMATGAVIKP